MPQFFSDEDVAATILRGTATSETIFITGYVCGVLMMPDAWTTADIGFRVLDTVGNAEMLFVGGFPVIIPVPVVNQTYRIPEAVFTARRIQLMSRSARFTSVIQAAERRFRIEFK